MVTGITQSVSEYRMLRFLLTLSFFLSAYSVYSQDVPVPQGRRLREIVKEKYDGKVYIGATTGWSSIESGEGTILNREFSYITPANDFKQPLIHPEPGKWRWDIPDQWVESAEKNGQLIRMHAPISPQCSKWAREDSRTGEELKKNLTEYMTELCKHYNGRKAIRWLDVVNETIDSKGGWFGPGPGTDKWENPWPKIGFEKNIPSQYKLLNKDGVPIYIILAFEIATKYSPDLKLIINQHALIEEAPAQKMKELVMYLRGRSLRVDGIGWQAHMSRDWEQWAQKENQGLKTLAGLVDWAHKNNLEFHVTENNIHVLKTSVYDADAIASVFANIVLTLLERRDTGVVTWNLWSITDKPHYNAKNKQVLGLWDKDFSPQKSYYAVQKVLEGK